MYGSLSTQYMRPGLNQTPVLTLCKPKGKLSGGKSGEPPGKSLEPMYSQISISRFTICSTL